MYIVLYYLPQFDGELQFKVKLFSTRPEAEQFATYLEEHTFFDLHGIYEATQIR